MQQQWEYCVITGIHSDFAVYYPKLIYFSINGIKNVVDLGNKAASKRSPDLIKMSETGYVAHMIAKLGMEGWEMVSTGFSGVAGSGSHCIYFRRAINNPSS